VLGSRGERTLADDLRRGLPWFRHAVLPWFRRSV